MKSYATAVFVLALFGALGCSLITDFDENVIDGVDGGQEEGPYSLDANLDNPVVVTLFQDRTAIITLDLERPLPPVTQSDQQTLIDLFEEETITLTVSHIETGVTVSVLDGVMVEDVPNAPGEYIIEVDDTREIVTITFYNQFDGKSLQLLQTYSATIQVIDNENNLKPETFTRDVKTEV